jgi:hypothetical protein
LVGFFFISILSFKNIKIGDIINHKNYNKLCFFLYFKNIFKKIKKKIQINIFLVILDHFNVLMSKITFKK